MTNNPEIPPSPLQSLGLAGMRSPLRVPALSKHAFIVLPFPPSVNSLYAGKMRRYKSLAYMAWVVEAGHALNKQKPLPRFTGPVRETIRLGPPAAYRIRDAFNFEKALNDLLVEHGILEDDSLIVDGRILWDSNVVGAAIEIEERI